ncbi:MAG: hypothetical protein GWO08_20960 [Gammaproteobacteria bacterium]|nr:hypothetical protein [Gammaproteobacteria bacterium]NIN62740.1 hypothetical protein [Gammaproteobacteria bacterium]NIP50099.1 hypothetical protein [Gammaproteobacteria bacterium]NIQ12317.1 hypothetical protein [Gammaproteobacteria bacterium]NIQ20382.1 hypothetical protein [Gammaproteobacteria bacterium]
MSENQKFNLEQRSGLLQRLRAIYIRRARQGMQVTNQGRHHLWQKYEPRDL